MLDHCLIYFFIRILTEAGCQGRSGGASAVPQTVTNLKALTVESDNLFLSCEVTDSARPQVPTMFVKSCVSCFEVVI